MVSIRRVLLPTDFSTYAAEAAEHACTMADRFGAQLHILHVLEKHLSAAPQFGMGLAVSPQVEESEADAQAALQNVISAEWAEGRDIVRATAHGAPFVEIVRYARDKDIDLIVMATHGRAGLAHVLLGSVAERVVRKAPCAVLTVRPEGHDFVMP